MVAPGWIDGLTNSNLVRPLIKKSDDGCKENLRRRSEATCVAQGRVHRTTDSQASTGISMSDFA